MTTIAWDGETLATDSYEFAGDMLVNKNCKKLFKVKGAWIASAGETQDGILFMDWYKNKTEEADIMDQPNLSDDFAAVVLEDGRLYEYEHKLAPMLVKGPYAWGCGGEMAMIAMACGKTAVEAVKLVNERHAFSGGKVQHVTNGD